MNWKDYSALEGTHAFLSPSRSSWLGYSDEKLVDSYRNFKRVKLGIRLHSLAEELISLAIKLPNTKATLNRFVNDAIGFRMSPEVVLYHSTNCYGTADAISFNDGVLRIHDLKTGVSPGSINQPLIYAALFCLNYGIKPRDLKETYLRIYHNEEILEFSPSTEEIFSVVSRIVEADRIIEEMSENIIL